MTKSQQSTPRARDGRANWDAGPRIKALIEEAADMEGQSMSAWMKAAALARAKAVLGHDRVKEIMSRPVEGK